MRQNAGWLAAFGVAVAAFFGFSVLPSRNVPATPPTAPQQKEAESPKAVNPGLDALKLPCREIEKRILPFLPLKQIVAPEECYQKRFKPERLTSVDENLQFLIATLPDPVHTHFSLQFDRLADALQQAAQDEDFVYDSSWLPWDEQVRQYSALKDQDATDDRRDSREGQPGLLVFRGQGDKQGLLIFIVGESPTAGINVKEFEDAIGWIRALRPNGAGHSLHILGPVFSGSFLSLNEVLGPESEAARYIGVNNQRAGAAI